MGAGEGQKGRRKGLERREGLMASAIELSFSVFGTLLIVILPSIAKVLVLC